jgi:hypothetical protein
MPGATYPRPGRSNAASGEFSMELLALQKQLFEHWHQWKYGLLAWPEFQHRCHPIRGTFEATLTADGGSGL